MSDSYERDYQTMDEIDKHIAEIVTLIMTLENSSSQKTSLAELARWRLFLAQYKPCDLAKFDTSGTTVCKNAVIMAEQSLIDIGYDQIRINQILSTFYRRGIQIHMPVTPG
jgi:hypothetical protein